MDDVKAMTRDEALTRLGRVANMMRVSPHLLSDDADAEMPEWTWGEQHEVAEELAVILAALAAPRPKQDEEQCALCAGPVVDIDGSEACAIQGRSVCGGCRFALCVTSGAAPREREVSVSRGLCSSRRHGYTCTLSAGHEGEHEAHAGHSDYVRRWPPEIGAAPREREAPASLVALVTEWQEARKPAVLSAPGVCVAETYQAAVKRMAAADEALARYRLGESEDDATDICENCQRPIAGQVVRSWDDVPLCEECAEPDWDGAPMENTGASLRDELAEIIRWRFKSADGKPMNGPGILERAQEIADEIAPMIEEATGER